MSRVILVWELGGGLGHLARLAPVARELRRRGHEVSLIAREVARASALFPGVEVLQAPLASAPPELFIREPASFAEILFDSGCHDSGCHDAAPFATLIQAWRALFERLRPDVVVLDFAPFALLALQGMGPRTLLLGTGFACPPDRAPLPDLRPWQDHYPERLWLNESLVLERMNERLTSQGQPPLERVAALFARADANLLATFPELDHYQQRAAGAYAYVGTWSDAAGRTPRWPDGTGPRVFAYLKPCPVLPALLRTLSDRRLPALIYLAGDDTRLTGLRFGATLRIVHEPVDMRAAAVEADLAILHAGHGSTAEMLLAGTPILQLPLLVEQGLIAECVTRMGAGLTVMRDDAGAVGDALDHVLRHERWQRSARRFADRHRSHDPARAVTGVAERIERLAAGDTARARHSGMN